MRTPVPNSGATYRLNGFYNQHSFALIGAQGPRNGIVKVYKNALLQQTIDLYAPKWRPRVVVASMMMGPRDRFTIVNATPTGRPNSDIHLDALFDLDPNDCSRCRARAER